VRKSEENDKSVTIGLGAHFFDSREPIRQLLLGHLNLDVSVQIEELGVH
jgi:hypothetical protein